MRIRSGASPQPEVPPLRSRALVLSLTPASTQLGPLQLSSFQAWAGFRGRACRRSAVGFRSLATSGLGHIEVMTSRGVVRSWDVQGVIDSADTPPAVAGLHGYP